MTVSSPLMPFVRLVRGRRAARLLTAVLAVALVTGAPGAAAAVTEPAVTDPAREGTLTVEGTLERVVVDREHAVEGAHGEAAELETASLLEVDEAVYALPDGVADDIALGAEVAVTLDVADDVPVEEALADVAAGAVRVDDVVQVSAPAPAGTQASVAAATLGVHTLTVLPVRWTGAEPATTSQLSTLAADTAAYWSEQSDGRIAVRPDVRPAVTIPAPSGCAATQIMTQALAANPGVTASGARHVLVYFPRIDACGWEGMASVGGPRIWVNGTLLLDVAAHELGHNLGLGHADAADCSAGGVRVPLSAVCRNHAYRDYADVMGSARTRVTGNLNSALADWLGLAVVHRATNAPATVQLAPLGSVRALRALTVPVGPGVDLYVDFRPAVGRDTRWSSWAGVQVHLRTVTDGIPRTQLLDMQPGAGFFVAPQLGGVGASWTIPGTGRTLRLTAQGAGSATVELTGGAVTDIERYVGNVYTDLFGRTPDPQGFRSWTTALLNGTPRVAVANSITSSEEYRARLIAGAYRDYLGRTPDAGGLLTWQGAMAAGWTVAGIETGFVASAEYYARAGGTDAAWVGALYADVLDRTAAPSEVAGWTAVLRGGTSRDAVARGFLLSTEHLSTVVDGHYRTLLDRGLDPVGQRWWVGALQAGGRDEAIIGGIIASDEYFAKR